MEEEHGFNGRLFSYIGNGNGNGNGNLGLENHPQMMAFSMNPTPNPNPNPKSQRAHQENSDEEEDSSIDGKRKSISQWHRMKWTDSMVRLLIMAVYYIGDESGSEFGSEKRKTGAGQLQKKGKWKSVSKAMMEKGFCVSPQQCEDKFNDLNKRYKRVNEILGKGIACKVVENQSLLETMDHIVPKRKEEVRKLLNSKHLFFKEMCAYHNTCGHTSGLGSGSGPAIEAASQQQQQNNLCLHSPIPQFQQQPTSSSMGHNDDSDSDPESDSDSESDGERPKKLAKMAGDISSNSFRAVDLTGVLQDVNRSSWEKKQWVMTQLAKLEENGVRFQYQSLEIEKQRMKWMKFSSKKEREMDRNKIENERKKLENERMVLLLRQKELELFMIQQRSSNISSVTG